MQMSRKRKAENQDHGPVKKKITEIKTRGTPQSGTSPGSKHRRKKKRTIFKVISRKSPNQTQAQNNNLVGSKESNTVASRAKKKRPFFKKERKVAKELNAQDSSKKGSQLEVTKSPDGKRVQKKKNFKKVKDFQKRKTEKKKEKKPISAEQRRPEKVQLPSKPEEISSNWKQLQQSIGANKSKSRKQERSTDQVTGKEKCDTSSSPDIWFDDGDDPLINALKKSTEQVKKLSTPPAIRKTDKKKEKTNSLVKQDTTCGFTKVIAMDCEMVGVGDGVDSVLARVSLVNHYGHPLYDKFVKPKEKVTDYRTHVSGVRPQDLKNAEEFSTVQKEVSDMLKDRILVGHAVNNDLKVLFLSHPRNDIRDTSRYRPFRHLAGGRTPGLKKLTAKILGVTVQEGEHSSVEDAQAAMRLYTMYRKEWESRRKKRRTKRLPKQKQGKNTNNVSAGETDTTV